MKVKARMMKVRVKERWRGVGRALRPLREKSEWRRKLPVPRPRSYHRARNESCRRRRLLAADVVFFDFAAVKEKEGESNNHQHSYMG